MRTSLVGAGSEPTSGHPVTTIQPQRSQSDSHRLLLRPVALLRLGITGILMGLAFLVPGVSGGTMVLVMGLYDEFVSSIADITRLRFTKKNVLFLAVVVGVAVVIFVSCAGPTQRLVTAQRTVMYSLFVGLTLGGVPMLHRLIRPFSARSAAMVVVGLLVMIGIAATNRHPTTAVAAESSAGGFVIEPSYGLDVIAGVLSISAMVLPGISGAYMLLVIGRYETVLASIEGAKQYAFSGGLAGDPAGLYVLIPVGFGVFIGVVGVSNLLKWLLHKHEKVTLSLLMGVLLGSVAGIWPFDGQTTAQVYGAGFALAAVGFGMTFMLSRLSGEPGG